MKRVHLFWLVALSGAVLVALILMNGGGAEPFDGSTDLPEGRDPSRQIPDSEDFETAIPVTDEPPELIPEDRTEVALGELAIQSSQLAEGHWTLRGFVRDEQGEGIAMAEVWIGQSSSGTHFARPASEKSSQGKAGFGSDRGKWGQSGRGKAWSKAGVSKQIAASPEGELGYLPAGKAPLLESRPESKALCGEDGSFQVSLEDREEAAQWLWICASAEHFVTATRVVSMELARASVELKLARAVTIAGQVRSVSGEPIEGAEVWTWRSSQQPVLTSAEGAFALTDVDPNLDSHYVHASAAGFLSAGQLLELDQLTTDASSAASFVVNLELREGSAVEGVVIGDGLPVADAELSIGKGKSAYRATSDANGAFSLDGAPTGRQLLWVRHPQFVEQTREIHVPEPGTDLNLTIQLESGRRLSGIVLDPSGAPIAGARLTLRQLESYPGKEYYRTLRQSRSDEAGEFAWAALPGQELSLDCSAKGFVQIERRAVPFGIERMELRMFSGTQLRGRVVTTEGEILTGAMVRAVASQSGSGSVKHVLGVLSDEQGDYELSQLGPGVWDLVVEHPACLVFVQPIEIPTGVAHWHVDLEVHSQGQLLGSVRRASGEAMPGAELQLQVVDVPGLGNSSVMSSEGWAIRNETADAAGHFNFDNLPAGLYGLRRLEPSVGLDGKTLWLQALPVRIQGRESKRVELIVGAGATVTGSLSAPVGLPELTYVQLIAVPVGGADGPDTGGEAQDLPGPLWARAQAGAFSFTDLQPGLYDLRVMVTTEGGQLQGAQRIEVSEGGEHEVVVELR